MEVTWDYLQDHHAWENSSRVERDSKVYFVVDDALNEKLRRETKDENAFVILYSSTEDGKTITGCQVVSLPS